MKTILINSSCCLTLFSALFVIVSKNPLHSILFLVSAFMFSSITLFLLGSEFFALFFLIIYLGAIAVLFLFVVMMLDIKHNDLKVNKVHFPAGVFIGGLMFLSIITPLSRVFKNTTLSDSLKISRVNWYAAIESTTEAQTLGHIFYDNYAAQILIVGLLLYVAVLGVIFMAVKRNKKNSLKRSQSTTRQLSRRNVL